MPSVRAASRREAEVKESLAQPLVQKGAVEVVEPCRTTSPSPDGEAAPTETLTRTWKQAQRLVEKCGLRQRRETTRYTFRWVGLRLQLSNSAA
ncbi:hypothetical protein [Nostoc sp.]|uniref:hypothetical protein n=1 Tax=Nostoc sp. TaxID=1180 RepID=UPI002FF4D78C